MSRVSPFSTPTALRISFGIATRRLLPTSTTLTSNSIGKVHMDSQRLHLLNRRQKPTSDWMSVIQQPFYRAAKFYLVIVVLAVSVAVPTITYSELSYNSVNGTHPEIVTGYRSVGFCSATFYVTVHVWSWAGSLDTQVRGPSLTLTVNNLPFGTQVGPTEAFQPNNYASYSLTF